MEAHVLVLQNGIEEQKDADYYLSLICQDFTHLVPFERVRDFDPGYINDKLFQVYAFKVKKELKKNGANKLDLPNLPRQVREGNQRLQFKQNGVPKFYRNNTIVKRTLTAPDKPYTLWEFVLLDDATCWTVLHHYSWKNNKRPREEVAEDQPVMLATTEDQIPVRYIHQEGSMHDRVVYSADVYSESDLIQFPEGIASPNTAMLSEDSLVLPDEPVQPVLYDGADNTMQEDDSLLPDIPTHVYYQLLNQSIAQKKFFNRPVKVHDELFGFKCKLNVQDEAGAVKERDEDLSLNALTCDNFEFLTKHKFIHLVSPAGTGKTMAMTQLAKSFEREQHNLVTVLCKGMAAIGAMQ